MAGHTLQPAYDWTAPAEFDTRFRRVVKPEWSEKFAKIQALWRERSQSDPNLPMQRVYDEVMLAGPEHPLWNPRLAFPAVMMDEYRKIKTRWHEARSWGGRAACVAPKLLDRFYAWALPPSYLRTAKMAQMLSGYKAAIRAQQETYCKTNWQVDYVPWIATMVSEAGYDDLNEILADAVLVGAVQDTVGRVIPKPGHRSNEKTAVNYGKLATLNQTVQPTQPIPGVAIAIGAGLALWLLL